MKTKMCKGNSYLLYIPLKSTFKPNLLFKRLPLTGKTCREIYAIQEKYSKDRYYFNYILCHLELELHICTMIFNLTYLDDISK